MPQTAWVSSSWSWSQLGDKMPAWESASWLRACSPQWPTVEQPQPRWGRSAAMVRRTLGQYVAVCPRLQLTSHTKLTSTLSRIKCERYIFIKKCVRSFIEVVGDRSRGRPEGSFSIATTPGCRGGRYPFFCISLPLIITL